MSLEHSFRYWIQAVCCKGFRPDGMIQISLLSMVTKAHWSFLVSNNRRHVNITDIIDHHHLHHHHHHHHWITIITTIIVVVVIICVFYLLYCLPFLPLVHLAGISKNSTILFMTPVIFQSNTHKIMLCRTSI